MQFWSMQAFHIHLRGVPAEGAYARPWAKPDAGNPLAQVRSHACERVWWCGGGVVVGRRDEVPGAGAAAAAATTLICSADRSTLELNASAVTAARARSGPRRRSRRRRRRRLLSMPERAKRRIETGRQHGHTRALLPRCCRRRGCTGSCCCARAVWRQRHLHSTGIVFASCRAGRFVR
eukprot:5130039-Prymnesium_polylepis.1